MSHLVRDFQFLTHFLAALTVAGCTTVEFADKVSQANPLDSFESDVVARVNQLRTSAGVPTVNVCATLNVATSAHSDDMRDRNYLSDVAPEPDASTTPERACAAGYTPACNGIAGMVEFIAKGNGDGAATFTQWQSDMSTNVMLTKPEWTVAGIGRSLGADAPIWTMNLADKVDASCEEK